MFHDKKQNPDKPVTLEDVTKSALWSVGSMFDDFVVFPSPEARDAAALWVLHTWAIDAFHATPRLSLRSAEPGSGKSIVLDLVEAMSRNGRGAIYITPAVYWTMMDQGMPTLCVDEIDTVYSAAGSAAAHVVLRSIMNAGYRRGKTVPRKVGGQTRDFEVFGPLALAGIGRLPDTIASRSVEIIMRKPREGDKAVREFRPRFAQDGLAIARRRCEAWAKEAVPRLMDAMPEDIPASNRAKEVWEPLIAVADLAGAEWSKRARVVCKKLTEASSKKPVALGTQLLADMRAIMEGRERITSAALVTALLNIRDGVWTPENLDQGKVSRLLAEYGVRPKMLRVGEKQGRGYLAADLGETWERFAPQMAVKEKADA